MLVRFSILLVLLLTWFRVMAHQPDLSSTMLVEQGDDVWVLAIRAALTGFEYEVDTHFGEDSFTTPEEFQNLVLKHVLENLTVRANEQDKLELKNGVVKLGHETSVVFQVLGMPDSLSTIEVTNSSFKDISRNQSSLMILKDGYAKDQFTLNNKNEHTAKLLVKDGKFVKDKSSESSTEDIAIGKTNYLYLGIAAIGLLLALFFGFKMFKQKRSV